MLFIKAKQSDLNVNVPTTAISLTPADLPFIVNAPSGCPKEYSPFQACFTNEKIRKAWSNIGFVPFTMYSTKTNHQIRREIDESTPQDTKLENLQLEYECVKSDFYSKGWI